MQGGRSKICGRRIRPMMRNAGLEAESGRGLPMVNALTGGQWGWNPKIGRSGECVWAVLPLYGAGPTARGPAPVGMTWSRNGAGWELHQVPFRGLSG
jgi:hypothetical protein